MFGEEREDLRRSRHECVGQIGIRGVSDHDEKKDPVRHDGCKLVRLVADASIVRYSNPAARSDSAQPRFVGAAWRKMIDVPLYLEASGSKNMGKLQSKISVREEDNAQAARSYTAACSMSPFVNS